MVARYDNLGVRFSYPENWTVVEDQATTWPRSVSVYSPTEAFWNVSIHEPATDLDDAVDVVLDTMGELYTDLESSPAEQTIAGQQTFGRDLHFYCLDFLVQAKIRAFELGTRKIVVLCQGEDREFDELKVVFDAITHDLITNQEDAAE